jgi:alpha-galactosidase
MRDRIKVEKATHGPHWAYNAYVNQQTGMHKKQTLKEFDTYWASIVGIGGIPTSFYGDPSPEVFDYYKKWYKIYFREMFSDGEYLNLYDIAYSKPEMHTVKKNGILYYGIYANEYKGKIELRGLDAKSYKVKDYVNDISIGEVKGPNTNLQVDFKNYLLIKCVPVKTK